MFAAISLNMVYANTDIPGVDIDIPDVSAWNCPAESIDRTPAYAMEQCGRDGSFEKDIYLKVANEVIAIHEHRMFYGQEKYYSVLKLNSGEWVETLLNNDGFLGSRLEADKSLTLFLVGNNGRILGTRNVPKVK